MTYGCEEQINEGEGVIRYLHGLPDATWHEPTPDDPLSLIDQVELSMTYGCEEKMSRRTLLRYIHQNRNYNSLKINTMGALIEKLEEEEEKLEAAVAKGIVDARNLIDEKMEEEEEKMTAAVAKGIADARSYTTSEINDAKVEVKSFTNSEINDAKTEVKSFTTSEIDDAKAEVKNY